MTVTIHGQHGTRTYRIWCNMKARCQRSTHPRYKDWGGRGIKVCERWQSFENFLADMGAAPPEMSIDRYPDNDGHYEPGNCRWATSEEQHANKREQLVIRKPREKTASGLLGAIYEKSRNKWRAVIKLDGKQRLLGRFDTAVEAHQAYLRAARAAKVEVAS